MITLERESVEYIYPGVLVDGVATTSNLEFAVVHSTSRPTGWVAAVDVDGKAAYLVQGLAAGAYRVFARITDTPEIPVIDCGELQIR